jgi:hypothetical protein
LPRPSLPALSLAAALLATACAINPGRPACQPRRVEVANLGARPVEQLYYGAPGAWGEDLLDGAGLQPGAVRHAVLPGITGPLLRAVWADGRAIELRGLAPCRTRRIVMMEDGIRAD